MNFEKVKYPISILDKMTVGLTSIFLVFSSKKKRMSYGFSPFERNLSFGDCYLH